ncbi:hypothetical protein N9411_00675 [bacterium]|nr:hypothetical protein [bacterium]
MIEVWMAVVRGSVHAGRDRVSSWHWFHVRTPEAAEQRQKAATRDMKRHGPTQNDMARRKTTWPDEKRHGTTKNDMRRDESACVVKREHESSGSS